MKFSLFVHMIRDNPEQSYTKLYEDFIELCQMADQSEMRAIWTGEHHAMNYAIAPNPFITIADLCRYTKKIKLGTNFNFKNLIYYRCSYCTLCCDKKSRYY